MSTVKNLFLIMMCIVVMGCVSKQEHERALEELEMTYQNSVQEIDQLQQKVEQERAKASRVQEEHQELTETVNTMDAALAQLQKEKQDLAVSLRTKESEAETLMEAKEELAQRVEVQDQVKEQQLQDFKQKIEDLYAQVLALQQMSGGGANSDVSIFSADPVDFEDLAQAFQRVGATLQAQMNEWEQLKNQNSNLEIDIAALEARLQGVDALRKELEDMRAAREAEEARYARVKEELEDVRRAREDQEARFAQVKHEVQTVGDEIDRITKALEEKFGKSLVVTQHQDRLVLTMLGQVLFESGEADLTPLGLNIMKQVGQVLASLPNKNIQVEGHTDHNPIYGQLQQRYPTNWELSTARATTVLRYLIEETNMDPEVFSATGYADTRPAATNETKEGRAKNRRVEIVLYPERTAQESESDQVANLTP